jgi:hypothetical protein
MCQPQHLSRCEWKASAFTVVCCSYKTQLTFTSSGKCHQVKKKKKLPSGKQHWERPPLCCDVSTLQEKIKLNNKLLKARCLNMGWHINIAAASVLPGWCQRCLSPWVLEPSMTSLCQQMVCCNVWTVYSKTDSRSILDNLFSREN